MAGFIVLVGACVVAMAGLPALGYPGYTFAVVAAALVGLVWDLAHKPGRPRAGRLALLGLLTVWLGLIAWSVAAPGGPTPPAKTDPDTIRVVSWNIHCGQDHGPPWARFDWPARKRALRTALEEARPDIVCVQEARPRQVAFLEACLPGHGRIGVGRDGPAGGEHCAVFFDRTRFEVLGGNTFWLSEPIDQPGAGPDVKRICTWVRLRDRRSGRTFRVYNTHQYLTEGARLSAAELLLTRIEAGDPSDAVVLTGDFNAPPPAPSRRLFSQAGLIDSAGPKGQATFHLYGVGLRDLDGVLVGPSWRVRRHLVLRRKPGLTFPSDHFAVLADLALAAQPH